METLIDWDKKLLLFLNGFHAGFLDPVMYLISQELFWLPLFLYLLYVIQKKYQKATWIILLGVAVTLLIGDQITSTLMKPYFARLRPSHDATLQGQLHLVKDFSGTIYYGGLYGFASSHAANTLGVALYLFFFLRPFYRRVGLLFLWAAAMTYTRIYLGVHFPGDILVGAGVGVFAAWIGKRVALLIAKKYKYELGLPS